MTFQFRPAKREQTPLIIGIAGPTKSGKTYSAHRVAAGLAQGGKVVMVNAEGAKGHQYADKFDYLATDIGRPYRPERYTEVLRAALEQKPAVVIVDSMSHMHDGPGGLLEYHGAELDRMAGNDFKKRDRMNWTAWIKPKAAENEFIYTLLEADCHVILCFRAKEKLKIVKGAEPVDLGWQPVASERIAFETIFTLLLPPHSKGVPDLGLSEMREPFDRMIPANEPLSEATGAALAAWSAGGGKPASRRTRAAAEPAAEPAVPNEDIDFDGTNGETDSDAAELTERLLSFATDDNRAAVESAVAKNKASHWANPGEHVAWLVAQVERAEQKVAAV